LLLRNKGDIRGATFDDPTDLNNENLKKKIHNGGFHYLLNYKYKKNDISKKETLYVDVIDFDTGFEEYIRSLLNDGEALLGFHITKSFHNRVHNSGGSIGEEANFDPYGI